MTPALQSPALYQKEDRGKEFKQGHLSRRRFQEANCTHAAQDQKALGEVLCSLTTKPRQIKTTMRSPLTQVRMATI